MGAGFSFRGRRAAHGADDPAARCAHARGGDAAAHAVRRRVRCVLPPNVSTHSWDLLGGRAPESRPWAIGYFFAAVFDSASYCAWHFALAWDFFSCRHAKTPSMLARCALHSLNTSLMQAERSSADGLNSAKAAVGSPLRTRASANSPRRILVITCPLWLCGVSSIAPVLQRPTGSRCDGNHKNAPAEH